MFNPSKQMTIPAANATNALTAIRAAGYLGNPQVFEFTYKPHTDDIYRGTDNTVTNSGATAGFLVAVGEADTERASGERDKVDLSNIWLYSVNGTQVSFRVRG